MTARRGAARPAGALTAPGARRLRPLLEAFAAAYDVRARLGYDPVELPRAYPDPGDAEVAGLFAAALAYGRADLFKPQLQGVLREMAPSPARFCEALAGRPRAGLFPGFRYRFNQPEDVAALAAAVGAMRRAHGSLGARFAALYAESVGAAAAPPVRRARGEVSGRAPIRLALTRFAAELRAAPQALELLRGRAPRGLGHLLPDPGKAGACKRWNLYLRWMVRGPDAVDLGLWRGVPTSALIVPLDTHIARIARHLGLTDREDLSWRTAEEITGGLRRLDPVDPVRFDFALCHLGMSGACPVHQDGARCAACALRSACRGRVG